jgi:O-antigen biosynthesis protein
MTAPAIRSHLGQGQAAVSSQEFSPAQMMDIELTKPLPTVSQTGEYRRIFVLGRLYTEPIGACVIHLDKEVLTSDQLGALLWQEFRAPVMERFTEAGFLAPRSLTGNGLEVDAAPWPFFQYRRSVLDAAPLISVIICTRDRASLLKACLHSLAWQEYPRFEIVVVDNAPISDAVRNIVKTWRGRSPLQYVLEPRPGLSWARNAGIAASSGEIIAFLDDDEEPDRYWLAGLACGFARRNDIGCVSGMVLPARLDTHAQELFEQLGGFSKGRGYRPTVFSRKGSQNPLYPLPPFGVGANMAFRRKALAHIGGFDVALGAGTPTFAGEDTLALTLILLAGYSIAYEPAALMRHHHREDLDGLINQIRGYRIGLTAFYSALLRHRPWVLPGLLRLIPATVRYFRDSSVTLTATPLNFPGGLDRRRTWILKGPVAYMRSLRRQARVAKRHSDLSLHGMAAGR